MTSGPEPGSPTFDPIAFPLILQLEDYAWSHRRRPSPNGEEESARPTMTARPAPNPVFPVSFWRGHNYARAKPGAESQELEDVLRAPAAAHR